MMKEKKLEQSRSNSHARKIFMEEIGSTVELFVDRMQAIYDGQLNSVTEFNLSRKEALERIIESTDKMNLTAIYDREQHANEFCNAYKGIINYCEESCNNVFHNTNHLRTFLF